MNDHPASVESLLQQMALTLSDTDTLELAGADRPILRPMDATMVATLKDNLTRWARDLLDSRPANSIAALTADWRVFVRWCHGHDMDCSIVGDDSPTPFPASQDTLDAFVRSIGETRKASTIRRYLASIATLHTGSGLPNPCTTPRIKQAVKVVAARQARANQKARDNNQPAPMPPRQAAGLREDHLDALEAEPAQLSLRDLRARALLWTAHDTLLRASELRQVRWRDFSDASGGSKVVFVPWTKTDQLGEGTYRFISGETWGHLRRWRDRAEADTRNDRLFEENDLVFRTLRGKRTIDETAMSRQAIWRQVKSTASALALDPAGFSAHSTRVGTAQDMLDADIGIMAVMDAGGWKTSAMPQHYAKAISATESGAAKLAKRRGR